MTPLKSQAIQTALLGDWKNAIALNQELLKEDPHDVETLNRLAFAYFVLGKLKDAQSVYQKVLRLDSQNPIATKNLKRLAGKNSKRNVLKTIVSPTLALQKDTMFLEESGKTKVIELINIAEPKVITSLMTGEFLTLRIKRLKIFVIGGSEQYVGMLPDDIGKRLIKLLKGGNCYQACVKSIQNRNIAIFIKETKRATRYKFQPSFVSADKATTKQYNLPKAEEDLDEPQEEES